MKILIDDERERLPDGSRPDVLLRTWESAEAFMELLHENDEVWLDHDLGVAEPGFDGHQWITLLELLIHNGHAYRPARITCVSDNPQGRQRIEQAIDSIYKDTNG